MTWDAMWIWASAQSTKDPLIQILPVPGKAMTCAPFSDRNTSRPISGNAVIAVSQATGHGRQAKALTLLLLAAERTLVRPGMKGLAAVPAEPRRGCFFPGPQPRLDLPGGHGIPHWPAAAHRTGHAPGGVVPGRQHVPQHVGGSDVPLGQRWGQG